MPKSMTMKDFRAIGLYALWGVVVFCFSLYLTFPIEKLKPYLEGEMTKALKQEVTFDSISTRFFTGLAFKKIQIKSLKVAPTPESTTQIDSLKLWLNPFFLLLGEKMVSIEGRLKGGTLKGKVSTGEDYLYVDLAVNALPLEELRFLESLGKIAPAGKLNGEVLFETEMKNLATSEGVFNLKSKQLTLRELSIATTMGDLKFENLNFNDLVFAGQIDKGKVVLKNVKIASGSIFGSVSGTVALGKKFDLSTADLALQFKVDDDLHKRFGIILDQFIPNKSDDGFYMMQLSESLSTYTESFGSKKSGRPPRLNPPMDSMDRDREEEPLREDEPTSSEPSGPPIPIPEPMNDPEASEPEEEPI